MSLQEQLYKEIVKSVKPGSGQRFLLSTQPQEWDWVDGGEYLQQAEYDHTSPAQNQEPYYSQSGVSIYKAYKTVIHCVHGDPVECTPATGCEERRRQDSSCRGNSY